MNSPLVDAQNRHSVAALATVCQRFCGSEKIGGFPTLGEVSVGTTTG
jgi:hypothetical protein